MIVDLSIDIKNGMIFYPGDPVPAVSPALTLEKDKCRVTALSIGSHTGTHLDAPAHFMPEGKTVDRIPLSQCMGRGIVIDLTGLEPCHCIEPSDLPDSFLQESAGISVVVFHTGWTEKAGTPDFFKHPYLSRATAQLLVQNGITAVGVDMLNVDRTVLDGDLYTKDSVAAHEVLLGNEVLIVENLTNLESVTFAEPYFLFLPLKIAGGDGSPVRAVAADRLI